MPRRAVVRPSPLKAALTSTITTMSPTSTVKTPTAIRLTLRAALPAPAVLIARVATGRMAAEAAEDGLAVAAVVAVDAAALVAAVATAGDGTRVQSKSFSPRRHGRAER